LYPNLAEHLLQTRCARMCTRTKRSPPLPNRCLGRTRRGYWTSGGIHSCGAQARCEAFQEQGQRHLRSLHTSTPVETKPSHSRHNCNQHCGNDRADLRHLQGPSRRLQSRPVPEQAVHQAVLPGKVFVHPPSQNNYLGRTSYYSQESAAGLGGANGKYTHSHTTQNESRS
jgi:hypothetical protein